MYLPKLNKDEHQQCCMSQSEWKVFFSSARFVKTHPKWKTALLLLILSGFCTCTSHILTAKTLCLQVLSLIILRLWWSLSLLHTSEVLTSKTRSLCSSQGHTFAHNLFWIDFSSVYKMRLVLTTIEMVIAVFELQS